MHDRLIGLLERADLALASCTGVIPDVELTALIGAIRSVRTRLAYPDDILVVALSGGTGSGKSSLFNALNGNDLADVGGVRPTTSVPAASVPTSGVVDAYLDRLGIEESHPGALQGICLIDLPDYDSVESEHRSRVDQLLPVVDVVVWVTDPEKYRDDRFHREYVSPMARYSDQFVFVLNQVDRLRSDQVETLLADMRLALVEDGVANPVVIPVAAAPVAGPAYGIEELVEHLERMRDDRNTLYSKLIADMTEATAGLDTQVGQPVDFDKRAARVGDEAAVALAARDTVAATGLLSDFVDTLAEETGGPTADKLARLVTEIPRHVSRVDSTQGTPEKSRWWPWGGKPDPAERLQRCRDGIDESVIRPARVIVARRAVAAATIQDLALHLQDLDRV